MRAVATCWLVLTTACDPTISLGHDERQSDGGGGVVEDTAVSSTSGSNAGSGGERDETAEGGRPSSGTGGHDGHTTESMESTEDGTTFVTTGDETGDESVDACNFDPRDGECLNCVKSFCCPEAQSCAGEPGCACMYECLSGAGMPSACMQQCDANAESMQLALCIGVSCPGACS